MFIDLRSDTVTKPSMAMKEAMFLAEVGDDVFGDDPTVLALEEKAANLFGKEAALFCPSGTMTNQLAIRVHTWPGSEVICDKYSHIYLYEGGGVALNSFSSLKLLDGDRGRLNAQQVRDAINNPEDIHQPTTSLISLENTMNKGGGCFYQLSDIQEIRSVCDEKKLPLHLDGARLFNALVETNDSPLVHGQLFDSISICLSKGLGCPVGSLLLGKKDFIKKARRFRKVMGGGWRQAGFLAAAGIYALDNNIERLKEDHARAKQIGKILEGLPFVENIYPIDTNIAIFQLPETILASDFVAKMKEQNIGCVVFGKHLVRFVTHLDFTDIHLEEFEKNIRKTV
ncbi:L-allo-threonine aldolase [Emticicia aquatica]|jgi:threonine aldolase|uniref:L-allo-threonine aldolase n=1 Tax=Emticicia aquatica TaxID=1681835 RepID=A0ABM9ALS7_9BACT|nr:GntG family PLP-dependent aldolase [Emticicia aquatica]CAH0994565.1 L-allo-threonine aldolase [Emticicia aquatica]